MASSNDWLVPALGIGALVVGGVFILPELMKTMKNGNGNGNGGALPPTPMRPEDELITKGEAEEIAYKASKAAADKAAEIYGSRRPRFDIMSDDDAYIITDEDFGRLDIGRRDRSFLNRRRKIKDARLDRVLYGDDINRPVMVGSYNVNTVTPYGQVPSREFMRFPSAGGEMSSSNTRGNTINLY